MKIATATVMMLENWMKPSVCTKIMCLQCKTGNFLSHRIVYSGIFCYYQIMIYANHLQDGH